LDQLFLRKTARLPRRHRNAAAVCNVRTGRVRGSDRRKSRQSTEAHVSNSDSFIDEVTEEVRRDRLFGGFRRYGWIGVLAVLALVGGAAWNEWSKAQTAAAAQAKGDAILAALVPPDAAARAEALAGVTIAENGAPVPAMLLAAAQDQVGDQAGARVTLQALAADPAAPQLYRDLAAFKAMLLAPADMALADRLAGWQALAAPGATLRLLASEQMALAYLAAGERDQAVTALDAIVQDAEVTPGLRERVQGLMVALGETIDAGAGN